MSNKYLTARRWIKLFVIALISSLFCVFIYPVLDFVGKIFNQLISKTNFPTGIILIWLFITTFLWFMLIRLGGFRAKDVWSITSIKYPPTWFSVFIAVLLYICLVPFVWGGQWPNHNLHHVLLVVVSIIPGVFTASLLHALLSPLKSDTKSQAPDLTKTSRDIIALMHKPEAFLEWLSEEKPIQDPSEDLFELSSFAKRIYLVLQDSPLKTIALVGDYGCGKSSILRMTKYFISNSKPFPERSSIDVKSHPSRENRIIMCEVCGWGLHKGAAPQHILGTAIETLSKHVDCLGLIGIPSHYRSALSTVGSKWGSAVAMLLDASQCPLEILRELDSVLACVGKRLVICLEDLDRNTFDKTYWDEIASLLDRLKDLDNISFILAVNQNLNQDSALLRVSEQIEIVPSLPRTHVIACIKAFRNICLNKFREDIDSRTREERDKHLGLKQHTEEYAVAEMLGMESNEPIAVLANVLSNPRALKSALRDTLRSWRALHGEIDFDDLLVARAIYAIAPEAFAFINGQTSKIRQLTYDSASDYTRKRNENIRKELKTKWDNLQTVSWDKKSVEALIEFLFPGWLSDGIYRVKVPQGISRSRPTDYWLRLNKEEIPYDEIMDQVALLLLKEWKDNIRTASYKGMTLPEAILSEEGLADKVEQFGEMLDGSEIRSLASALIDAIIKIKKGRGTARDDYPGFLNLWRLALDKPIDDHRTWVLGEIKKTLPHSLQLANDIYYYWRTNDRSETMTNAPTHDLRKAVIAEARGLYNTPDVLIRALNPEYPWSLHHFVNLYNQPKYGGYGFDPNDWLWLSNILLEAAKLSPEVIIPQLAILLISGDAAHNDYKLREDVVKLFAAEKEVMELLSKPVDLDKYADEARGHIKFGQKYAAEWIHDKMLLPPENRE